MMAMVTKACIKMTQLVMDQFIHFIKKRQVIQMTVKILKKS